MKMPSLLSTKTKKVGEPSLGGARPSIEFGSGEFKKQMALVPAGETMLADVGDLTSDRQKNPGTLANIDSFFIDRCTVTNRDFASFVSDGAYGNMDLWPEDIWHSVLQFLDKTRQPGPRFWAKARPPKDQLDHPVVGVCFFEAAAYASWAGKMLPTAAQWQHAGTWSNKSNGEQHACKYPWGDSFDSNRANTWQSELGTTAPASEYYDGATANGVYQLVGNVWEWVDEEYSLDTEFQSQLMEIRGGAFDTYFQSQANCLFRSGQPVTYRAHNVGFRCCLPAN